MYAIIEDSGTQIKVSEGDVITVDRRDLTGDAPSIDFDRVLLIGGGDEVTVTFDTSALEAGGDYTYFCSFPGHYVLMNGKFIVE